MNGNVRQGFLDRYTTPGDPIAFSGRRTVAKEAGLTDEQANEEILSYNYSYPLHRKYRKPTTYNPYMNIRSPRDQIQCDLIDMIRLQADNDGYNYILAFIDVFSRYLWVKLLKTKAAAEVKQAFIEIIEEWRPNKPKQISCDQGREFTNAQVKQVLRANNITMFHPNAPGKAVYAERVNGTLQRLIYQYLNDQQTNRYIDVLNDLVKTYNNRGHRSLNFEPPREAERDENLAKFKEILRKGRDKAIHKGLKSKIKFKVGDVVRIRRRIQVFDRGYNETFTQGYFTVRAIDTKLPIPLYLLHSMNERIDVPGGFYANEMQLIKGDVYKVEKVIRRRTRRGQVEYFVKWLGFDNTHNSWVQAADMQ